MPETEKFSDATNELKPIADLLYKEQPITLEVPPARIKFLMSKEKRTAYAYTRLITGPYLTISGDYEFFIIGVEEHWSKLTPEQQKWVVLHEMYHCSYNQKGENAIRKHDVEDFEILLNDAKWNLELVRPKGHKEV
jgi:hypothetical protein